MYYNFKISQTYLQAKAIFIIPPGRPYSSIEKLFWPFDGTVWYTLIGMISTFGCIVIMYHCIGVAHRHISMFQVARILLGLDLGRFPVSAISKGLTVLVMLNFLILRNVYQGSLYNFLSNRKNVTPVQSIDQMVEDGFSFYIPRSCDFFFDNVNQIQSR